ncbi:hypothetical protein IF1G_09421 [Cordyceps javanica]|uniref:Uncharacterized protein n=1 Tax=Cordyceps javanica TaxID=43265 RepID=A0A545UQU9_9HYPO|nr:hypothetical protein IF1G_09421 [Cordyceps javanica]
MGSCRGHEQKRRAEHVEFEIRIADRHALEQAPGRMTWQDRSLLDQPQERPQYAASQSPSPKKEAFQGSIEGGAEKKGQVDKKIKKRARGGREGFLQISEIYPHMHTK